MLKINYKNLIKIYAISVIAIIGLFAFSSAAEAAFGCTGGGTVNDNCIITGTVTMGAGGETITGTGNLVINGTLAPSASTDISYFDFGGNITVNSGGSITTNFQATSTDFTVNTGGTINLNGKGYAGATTAGANGSPTGAGGGGGITAGGSSINCGGGGGNIGAGGSASGCSNNAGGGIAITSASSTAPTTLGGGGGSGYK